MARIAEGNVAKNDPRRREAEGRIRAARKFLWDPKRARQHARNAIGRGLRPVIRRLTCPIDVGALRKYVAEAGPEARVVGSPGAGLGLPELDPGDGDHNRGSGGPTLGVLGARFEVVTELQPRAPERLPLA